MRDPKEDVDGGAKPHHDDGGKAAVSCQERSGAAISTQLRARSVMGIAASLRSSQ
jgi:hypothetical protein